MAVSAQRVLLVIVLRRVEGRIWLNGGVDPPGGSLRPRDRLFGRLALRLGPEEDGRSILDRERLVRRRMAGEEECEQLAVRDEARVVVELYRLGMVPEVVVGRPRRGAAGVADTRADDTVQTPEPGIRSPESAKGEGGGGHLGRLVQIELRTRGRLGGSVREEGHGCSFRSPL